MSGQASGLRTSSSGCDYESTKGAVGGKVQHGNFVQQVYAHHGEHGILAWLSAFLSSIRSST
jgi:hypothetical protein